MANLPQDDNYKLSMFVDASGKATAVQLDSSGNLPVASAAIVGGAVTVANGADTTQGALADAMVAGGATGSVSAKLRRLTNDLAALIAGQPAALGQGAMVASSGVVIASDQTPVPTAGKLVQVAVTPVVSAGAYGANDCVGGIITLAGAARSAGLPTILTGFNLFDVGNQKAVLDVLLFNATPAGGTYTDNAAIVLAAADDGTCIAHFRIDAADYYTTVGSKADAFKALNIPLVPAATSIFALIMCVATPTFGAVDALKIKAIFSQS